MKTRRQRVENVKKRQFYLEQPQNARKVIDVILEHYSEKGYKEIELDKSLELLELPMFNEFGNLEGILQGIFENPQKFDETINNMTVAIYEDQA
jgi:type I restriction enzyme R subunit